MLIGSVTDTYGDTFEVYADQILGGRVYVESTDGVDSALDYEQARRLAKLIKRAAKTIKSERTPNESVS